MPLKRRRLESIYAIHLKSDKNSEKSGFGQNPEFIKTTHLGGGGVGEYGGC
jgi:hypothetical protein